MRARSLGIISLLLALWLSLSAGSIAAMPYPNDDSSGHKDEYVGEYTYTSTPNGQQLSELAGLSSDVSCQIVVSDPTFHTHNVSTAASQLCSGVFIRQSLIVCVQVERWFLFLPYWADLGCKSNSKSSFFCQLRLIAMGMIMERHGTEHERLEVSPLAMELFIRLPTWFPERSPLPMNLSSHGRRVYKHNLMSSSLWSIRILIFICSIAQECASAINSAMLF
jgi:hypothetical protein